MISFNEYFGQDTLMSIDDGVGLLEHLGIGHPPSLGSAIVNVLSGQLGANGRTEISATVPAKQTKGD